MKLAALGFLALVLGCKTPGSPNPAESSPTAPKLILQVIEEQKQAWNRGDIEGYMQGYAKRPTTSFASGDNMTTGWQETLDRYRIGYDTKEKMGQLEFRELKVEMVSEDAAMVTGRWELQREKDRPHGLFTLLFRKLPEGWRIVHDHTSAAKS